MPIKKKCLCLGIFHPVFAWSHFLPELVVLQCWSYSPCGPAFGDPLPRQACPGQPGWGHCRLWWQMLPTIVILVTKTWVAIQCSRLSRSSHFGQAGHKEKEKAASGDLQAKPPMAEVTANLPHHLFFLTPVVQTVLHDYGVTSVGIYKNSFQY